MSEHTVRLSSRESAVVSYADSVELGDIIRFEYADGTVRRAILTKDTSRPCEFCMFNGIRGMTCGGPAINFKVACGAFRNVHGIHRHPIFVDTDKLLEEL